MHIDHFKTLHDIRKSRPLYKDLRKNENRGWRESWVVVKFCESVNWINASVCAPTKDKGDDVFVKYNNKIYPFQVTEMAPRNPSVIKNLPASKKDKGGFITCEAYGSLAPQVTNLVKALVQKKDKIHYANPENMNLLIYLNPPGALFIDAKEDIHATALAQLVCASKFETISLYTNEEVIFIKGNINSMAEAYH